MAVACVQRDDGAEGECEFCCGIAASLGVQDVRAGLAIPRVLGVARQGRPASGRKGRGKEEGGSGPSAHRCGGPKESADQTPGLAPLSGDGAALARHSTMSENCDICLSKNADGCRYRSMCMRACFACVYV